MLELPTTIDGLQIISALDHVSVGLNEATYTPPEGSRIIGAGASAYTRGSDLKPLQIVPALVDPGVNSVTFSCVIPDDGLTYYFSYYTVIANCS